MCPWCSEVLHVSYTQAFNFCHIPTYPLFFFSGTLEISSVSQSASLYGEKLSRKEGHHPLTREPPWAELFFVNLVTSSTELFTRESATLSLLV